ncbi:MAG: Gfo/Idh/MocA family oxidoreductase [Deltaproteobacteria bacterium]|nr:Gfo/Idh/MocA family oxidoreductase [Deltaproteobacteria bacterium]
MTDGKTGAVVVGTGFGVLTHLRAMRAAGFEVQALVGRDPTKTTARAEQFDVPHGLTDLGEALALDGVEAVAIATPPHTHAELVLAAVAAGKHVVCEKPFAREADEARRMLDAAEAAGVVHMLGTEFRFATGQALATRAVNEGTIGEPRLASFLLQMGALADPAAETPAWWVDAGQGGGWLGAYASHVVDHMRVMLGEFTGLSASLALLSDRDWTAEDTYTVHFRTERGVDGILQSSAATYGPPVFCSRVVGSKGTLWIQGDDVFVADASGERKLPVPEDLRLGPPEPPPGELLVTAYDMMHAMGIDLPPYTRLFETFRDRIQGRPVAADPAAATFADGVAGQTILDAIREAARTHTWVTLD